MMLHEVHTLLLTNIKKKTQGLRLMRKEIYSRP